MSEISTSVAIKIINQASGDLQKIAGDLQGLKGAMGDAGTGGKHLSDSMGGVNNSLLEFGKSSALAIASGLGIATSFYELSRGVLAAGVNIQTVGTQMTVVFGKDAPMMTEKLNNLADSLGRDATEMEGFATHIAAIEKGLGVSTKTAENMSVALSSLAHDFSLAIGGTQADAANALARALEGNYRGLRDYNLVVNDSTVQSWLHKQGIDVVVSSLDEEAKSIAVAQFLLANTSDIQKEAALNAGNLADTEQRAGAAWQNFQDELATDLLPSITVILSAATQELKGFIDMVHDIHMPNLAKDGGMNGMAVLDAMSPHAGGDWTPAMEKAAESQKAITKATLDGTDATAKGTVALTAQQQAMKAGIMSTQDLIKALEGHTKASGSAATQADALKASEQNLGNAFDTVGTTIMDKLQTLATTHASDIDAMKTKEDSLIQKLKDLQTQANDTAESFTDMTAKFKESMAGFETQREDAVASQLQKVQDLQEAYTKSTKGNEGFANDNLVTVLANRKDKGDTLSARDSVGLTDAQIQMVNNAIALNKEEAALGAYLTSNLQLSKDMAASLGTGTTDFVKNAQAVIAANPALQSGVTRDAQTAFQKQIAQITKGAGNEQQTYDQESTKNAQTVAKNQQEQDATRAAIAALDAKRITVQATYLAERTELATTQGALLSFQADYTAKMANIDTVTKNTVKSLTEQLKILQQSLSSIDTNAKFGTSSASSNTNIIQTGQFPKFAAGGISSGPSIFGENGPEAAVPLPDGRSIPVTLNGGKGGNMVVNINIASMTVKETADVNEVFDQIARKVQLLKAKSY